MNNEQINQFIAEYGKDIFSFCRQMVINPSDAEDLYQDTFLVAISRAEIDFFNNPKSYLLSIAVNLWNNRKRKYTCRQRIAPTVSMDDDTQADAATPQDYVEKTIIAHDNRMIVREAVDKLPDKLRVVTVLYYMEDLDIRHIASAVGISQGTVKSRLFLARKKLEKELKELMYE